MTLAGIPDAHVTDTLILKQEEDDEEIAVRSSVRARSARISITRILQSQEYHSHRLFVS